MEEGRMEQDFLGLESRRPLVPKLKSAEKSLPAMESSEELVEQLSSALKTDDHLEENFDFAAKKKRRKSRKRVEALRKELEGDEHTRPQTEARETSDHDAQDYEDLLSRLYQRMYLDLGFTADDRGTDKFVIPEPQLSRTTRRETLLVNYLDICKRCHRLSNHMRLFMQAECSAPCRLYKDSGLIFRGLYKGPQIKRMIRSYILEYVICNSCRAHDTLLMKEGRLSIMSCDVCQSRRTVKSMKTSFALTPRVIVRDRLF